MTQTNLYHNNNTQDDNDGFITVVRGKKPQKNNRNKQQQQKPCRNAHNSKNKDKGDQPKDLDKNLSNKNVSNINTSKYINTNKNHQNIKNNNNTNNNIHENNTSSTGDGGIENNDKSNETNNIDNDGDTNCSNNDNYYSNDSNYYHYNNSCYNAYHGNSGSHYYDSSNYYDSNRYCNSSNYYNTDIQYNNNPYHHSNNDYNGMYKNNYYYSRNPRNNKNHSGLYYNTTPPYSGSRPTHNTNGHHQNSNCSDSNKNHKHSCNIYGGANLPQSPSNEAVDENTRSNNNNGNDSYIMSITETITAPYDTITKSIQKSKVWHRKTTGGVHLHEATLCDISPDKTSNTNSSLLTITTALSLLNVNKDSEDAMSAASPSSNSSFNSTMSSPNSDETSISSVSNDNNDSTFPSKHKKKVKVCRRVINRNRCKFLGYVREIDPIPVPLEDRYSGGSIREDNDDAYVRSPEELIADEYDSMNENHWINADTFVLKDKWPKAQFHFLVLPRRLIPTLDDLTSSEGIVVVRQLAERAKIVIERESKRSPHVKFMMGFHALPSMKQVHLHVISTDMDSIHTKKIYIYNSYTTGYFLSPDQVIRIIEERLNHSQSFFLSYKQKRLYQSLEYNVLPQCIHCPSWTATMTLSTRCVCGCNRVLNMTNLISNVVNQFDSGSTLEFNPDNSAVSFMSTDLSNNQLAENTHKSWENIGSDPDDSVTTTFDNNNSSVYTLGSWETRHADFAQLKRHLRQHYLEQAQKYLPCTDSWPKENQDSLLAFDSDTSSIEAVDSDVVDRYHGDGTHDGINVCDFDCENRLMCEQSSMVELL